jgi:curli biogenesis system outer membrane secretion channel CsgG
VGSEKAGPPPKAPKPPKMNSSPYMSFGSDPVAIGFHDMMIIALFNSNRFIVLERENLEKLNWEQEISHSAGSGNKTGLPTGQIEGAELLLEGSIKLEGNTSGGHLGGDFLSSIYNAIVSNKSEYLDNELRNTDFSWKNAKAYMHLRLIDTRTSRVVAATTVEGKSTGMRLEASKTKYKYAGNLPSSFSVFQNTPVGDAFRKMIDAAVEFLLTKTPKNYYHHQS